MWRVAANTYSMHFHVIAVTAKKAMAVAYGRRILNGGNVATETESAVLTAWTE